MTCYITPACVVNTLGICNSSYGTYVLCCLFLFYVVYSCSVLSVVFSAEKCMDLFSHEKFFVMLIWELDDLNTE